MARPNRSHAAADAMELKHLHTQLQGAIATGYLVGVELRRIEVTTVRAARTAMTVRYSAVLKHPALRHTKNYDGVETLRVMSVARGGPSEKAATLEALSPILTWVEKRIEGHQRMADNPDLEEQRASWLLMVTAYKAHLVELQNLQKRILGADPHLTVESTSR